MSGDNIEENSAIHDEMYGLRALRSTPEKAVTPLTNV